MTDNSLMGGIKMNFTRSKEDAASTAVRESWGSLTWLANKDILNAEGVTVGRVVIKKGCENPRHAHNTCDEILYLLSGTLDHSIGDEHVIIHAGDTLIARAGVFHNAVNIGDCDADMMVVYNSAERDFIKE